MIREACLVLLAVTHFLVAVSLFLLFFKVKNSINQFRADRKKVSAERMRLLTPLNGVASPDFRSVSSEAARLISKTSESIANLNPNRNRSATTWNLL